VLWNDVHFYAIHRLLHGRWLFQHIHREHHRAIRPTPFSTYAMHPIEALLLGSVMVLVQPFHAFSLPTLLLFPLVSLAMNNLGPDSDTCGVLYHQEDLLAKPLRIENGFAYPPEGPGLGVEVDMKVLESWNKAATASR